MIDFWDWCDQTGKDVTFLVDQPDNKKDTANENRARTGCKVGLYPPAYYDAQYPDLAKTPVAADAAYYISKRGKRG